MEMMLEVMMWVLDMEVDKVAKFLTNASGATWWPNFQLLQVAPPGDQIFVIVLKEKKCCCEEVGIVEEVTKSKN